MFCRRAACGFAALSLIGAPLDAAPLTATSGWNVDYGETQCIATRSYGAANKSITLAIRPTFTGETYELFESRPSPISNAASEQEGSVDLGLGKIKANVLTYHPPGSRLQVSRYRVASDAIRTLRDKAVFKLVDGVSGTSLTVDNLSSVKVALDRCLADLHVYWNYDPKHERRPSAGVSSRGDVRTIFSADDYPGFAQSNGLEGKARYILMINEAGLVSGCDLLNPSGIPILDFMGCEVIKKRAKFTPQRNSAGTPERSTFTTPLVSWKLG